MVRKTGVSSQQTHDQRKRNKHQSSSQYKGNNCHWRYRIPNFSSNSILMERNETQDSSPGGVEDGIEGYDEVDSSNSNSNSNNPARASYQGVSDSTQTEDFDTVDSSAMVSARSGRFSYQNGLYTNTSNRTGEGDGCKKIVTGGGIFSNLITMVLPMTKKLQNGNHPEEVYSNGTISRCMSTQTEESPDSLKARQLCCWVIQELVLEDPVPSSFRDNVFETLCCCVCEILDKHSILFSGMLRRLEVTNYRMFTSIANELFEATAEATDLTVTWGRIVSLFAFAVKLAQKCKENEDEEKLNDVIQYLSNYVLKYLLDFVENNEGWDGLVKHFPITDSEDKQMKRAMLLSGLCVGLVATMYAFTK